MRKENRMSKVNKISANVRQFPLVDQAEQAEVDLFSQHQGYVIPEYIDANLIHTLRNYQTRQLEITIILKHILNQVPSMFFLIWPPVQEKQT